MNYLLIVILALIVWSAVDGYRKGFMRTIFALISWIVVLVVCNIATPMVTDFLIEETSIVESISEVLGEKINEIIEESGINELEENIPEEISAALSGESGSFEELLNAKGEAVVNSTSIVYTMVGVIAIVLVMAVTRVMIMAIDLALGIASKLPLIGPLDKMLGFASGIVKGVFVAWIVLAIAPMVTIPNVNIDFVACIEGSRFLFWMQQNNLILKIFGEGFLFL